MDFIQNLPQFIPDEKIGNEFEILDKYPVTPYLDNRNSFIRWMHLFITVLMCIWKRIYYLFWFFKKYEKIYSQDNLTQTRNKLIKKYVVYLVILYF